MTRLFSVTSSKQHELEQHNPALCEELRIRDILDDVVVMTSGAFVAAYELSGVHSYYHTEEMRNRAKESFEAVLRSMPEGKDRHVAYWESVKVVDRREEEEDGTTIIYERERFSQRLTLLYADGRVALLSEKATESASRKENSDGERTPADGEADVCTSEPRYDHERDGLAELPCG